MRPSPAFSSGTESTRASGDFRYLDGTFNEVTPWPVNPRF
jgi:hypothetical protein